MKVRLTESERKSRTSVAISIAAHVLLFVGLAAITFHYPLFFAPPPVPMTSTVIRYIPVAPAKRQVAGGGGARRTTAPRVAKPTIVAAPTSIPQTVPLPVVPATPVPSTGVTVGASNQTGRAASVAAGVQPGIPDSRIAMNPMETGHLLKTDAQKADSALSAIYDMYLDSVQYALKHQGRAPGDWSWGGKDGDRWGWDQKGIHIGGITIPNAVLAALPLNIGPSGSSMNALTDGRNDAYMRSDIAFHANGMSEDDFRTAVNRIRARKDKEHQAQLAKQRKDSTSDDRPTPH